ncbi:helix-turn-helix domain-containing protein [Anaerocolumna xylanovorans]|uniref:Helix-turn-helix n=1 Tax=Anaerocolumna xylanovorans DSM 12503 TaxID=1121345 RepID=A0A1M7YIS0_9FIRM|nr:helix-turn-helix transcriptional regulator [Anaerocolumna xylanovorans]SHO52526.1 Helix-turn-helix [Anaerocolumna xylanovorans DSM 12503]
MSDISKVVGDRIRIVRNDKGLSIEELAERADVNTTHLGRIERGETVPKLDSIEKIVNALGITFEELFRHIQPAAEISGENDTALAFLINRLNTLKPAEQKEVLSLFEILFRLINK